jgi:hypothetical protein
MAEKVQVDVELKGADKAAKGLDDVADAAERVEDHDDVEVRADADVTAAETGLRDVADAADKLDGTDSTITARLTNETSGPLADIFGDLDKLEARAKEAGDKLDNVGRGGGAPKGQAIADLTGPLGDVSSQASDLSGVFDGMGDIIGELAPKMGLSADKMVGAIGGIGFAVVAASTVWGLFQQKQEEAKRKQEEVTDAVRKTRDALREGNFEQAAQGLIDSAGDAVDAFDDLGLSAREAFRYITGADNLPSRVAQELDALKKSAEDAQTELGNTQGTQDAVDDYQALIDKLTTARDRYEKANGQIDEQNDLLRDARDFLGDTASKTDEAAAAQKRLEDATRRTGAAFDALRDQVNLDEAMARTEEAITGGMDRAKFGVALTADEITDMKTDILDLAQTAKANPAEVASTLDAIDRGDLATVKADAERYYRNAPVTVTAKLNLTSFLAGNSSIFGAGLPTGLTATAAAAAPANVVNVTQYLPRGFRGDALGDARKAARRAGGLYQRFSR